MLFDCSQRGLEGADIAFAIGNKGDSFTGHSVRSYPRSADVWPYDGVQWAAQH
jgi:hypothetical protein